MALWRRSWNVILILLLIGTAFAQAATLDESHSSNHADHCCPVCHAGHLSVLQPVDRAAVAPLTLLCWHKPVVQDARLVESQSVLDHSRGPPA
jgi:hypothetical protein